MAALRVGVVPEHFCAPLHIAAADGVFRAHGVDVELVECPGGTGQMLKRLEAKELDVAIGLTEGLINSIANGNDGVRLVGTYVEAPLTWAVSTGAASTHTDLASLQGRTIGISRFGSGSHLMAVVLAEQSGWMVAAPEGSPTLSSLGPERSGRTRVSSGSSNSSSNSAGSSSVGRGSGSSSGSEAEEDAASAVDPFSQLEFVVLKDFEGLRNGVNSGRADAFLWETYTTKPYHDCNEVKRIGEVRAPWSAFMIAARRDVLDARAADVARLLEAISVATAQFIAAAADGRSQAYVAHAYGQRLEDVTAWLATVRYPAAASVVARPILATCLRSLCKARLVPLAPDVATLVDTRVAVLSDRALL